MTSIQNQTFLRFQTQPLIGSQNTFSLENFTNSFTRSSTDCKNKKTKNSNQIYPKSKKKILTEPSLEINQRNYLNLSGLKSQTIIKNKLFIKKKLQSIQDNALFKYNKILKNPQFFTPKVLNKAMFQNKPQKQSLSKQISIKLPDLNSINLFKLGSKFQLKQNTNKMNFLDNNYRSYSIKNEQKIEDFQKAYKKTENERIIRLLQKQEEIQERFSNLKKEIRQKMNKKGEKRLSKKDAHLFGNSLSVSIQMGKRYKQFLN